MTVPPANCVPPNVVSTNDVPFEVVHLTRSAAHRRRRDLKEPERHGYVLVEHPAADTDVELMWPASRIFELVGAEAEPGHSLVQWSESRIGFPRVQQTTDVSLIDALNLVSPCVRRLHVRLVQAISGEIGR